MTRQKIHENMMIVMKFNPLTFQLVTELLFQQYQQQKVLEKIRSCPVRSRFGRKKVLVASQLGLMTLGVAVGFSPSYSVLAFLKFVIGGLQQVGSIQQKVSISVFLSN